MQPDTIIPDLSNPQSWNRYSYVTNRPVNFSDPTGHRQCDDADESGKCIDSEQIEKRKINKDKRLQRELDNFKGIPTVTNDELITIGDKSTKWLFDIDPVSITPAEFRLLSSPHHFNAAGTWRIGQIRNEAIRGTVELFGYHERNGITDAFRHVYGSALMTREFGADFAESFTTAHETSPESVREEQFMDLHNNEVGRNIALTSPNASSEELISLVTEALLNGDAIVWDEKNMTYSNHCPKCSIP